MPYFFRIRHILGLTSLTCNQFILGISIRGHLKTVVSHLHSKLYLNESSLAIGISYVNSIKSCKPKNAKEKPRKNYNKNKTKTINRNNDSSMDSKRGSRKNSKFRQFFSNHFFRIRSTNKRSSCDYHIQIDKPDGIE